MIFESPSPSEVERLPSGLPAWTDPVAIEQPALGIRASPVEQPLGKVALVLDDSKQRAVFRVLARAPDRPSAPSMLQAPSATSATCQRSVTR